MNTNRIVMAVAGTVILVSLICGYFLSPYCLLVTGFVGASMLLFAFTGLCPLASLLTRLGFSASCPLK